MPEINIKDGAEVKAPLVIACGDEGVQLNNGCRFAFVGAGYNLPGFTEALTILREVIKAYPIKDQQFRIVASEENDYFKEVMKLNDWDETNACMQQRIAALADKEGLLYSGILPFSDPVELPHDVKGHMVRPHNIHIANKICFTLAGGESTYNLGQYVISADWLLAAPKQLAQQLITQQVEYYQRLAKGLPLTLVGQKEGPLGLATAEKNAAILADLGFGLVEN